MSTGNTQTDREREKHPVETMTAKKVLSDILNDLSSEELEEFKSLIEYEKDFAPISRSRLSAAKQPDLVELLVETNGQECVELTKKVLKKMKRTDLEQRLSDSSPGTKEKQWTPLIQSVEAIASDTELLLETLKDLTDWDFEEFKDVLWNQFAFYRGFSNISRLQKADRQETVFSLVLTDSQRSVEMTKVALKRIKRIDLVQRLSRSSSGPKKEHSLSEHLSALIHKVATMKAVKELLLGTLSHLSGKELKNFRWLLEFMFFQRSPSDVSWRQLQALRGLNNLVDVMVEVCGQQSVEVTKEVFMNMNRTDLVQRLPEISSGHKAAGSSAEAFGVNTTEREKHCVDEHCPALTQKVDTMASVIELLLETMADLSDMEHNDFKHVLLHKTDFSKRISSNSLMLLEEMHKQDTVFLMVQTEGQQSVETASMVLKVIQRPDLVQRVSESSSAPKEKHSEEPRPALIQGVAAMAAVQQLLLETLNDLTDEDLKNFKCILEETVSQKNLQSPMRLTGERAELVALLVQAYGKKSFDLTWEVVKQMNRTDLMQKLAEPSSGLKEKHCEHQPALSERAAEKHVLLNTLEDLSHKEFEKFKFLLQFTYFQKGLPNIPVTLLEMEESADVLVHLLVENRQPVEVTKEVFMDMNRPDLVERLSETSSGLKGPSAGLELAACGSTVQVSSDWTKVEPEATSTDEAQTYSLQTEAGSFECSVSGLRWVCKEKVSFKYQFCSTKYHMERIESIGCIPAGPLMDITVSAGKLDVVYLPHWICIDDTTLLDKFAVLHIDDCGHAVEKVSEVTSSHVKLCEPDFSLLMTLLEWLGTSVKIHCKVLLYKTNRPFLKLHAYLLPPDPAVIKELDETENSYGYERIRTQHPKMPLKMNEWFNLTAHLDGKEMASDALMLLYESIEPNFYQLFIRNPDKDIQLQLKQENELQPVWTCEILKEEYQSTGPVPDKQLSVPVQKEATITEGEKRLLEMLKDLSLEQFKEFKWHLRSIITWDQLENSDRLDVVKLMWQTCTQESFELTKNVFKEINRNDLVQMLSDATSGSKAAGSSA